MGCCREFPGFGARGTQRRLLNGVAMQRLFSLLVLVLLSLVLAACSKGGAGNNSGASGGSTQLSWDQGNWNQTNWQ